MAVTFPASLLQTLQGTLYGEAKRICRDAAKILRVPEKELTAKVLGKYTSNSILKLVDDNDAPLTCPIIIRPMNIETASLVAAREASSLDVRGSKQGSIFERCRGPCVLGTGRCLSHQTSNRPPDVSNHLIRLTRLEPHPDLQEPLWCREETNEVYDRSGAVIGEREEDCIILYTLGSEEEEPSE
jgi:hypothetical protein